MTFAVGFKPIVATRWTLHSSGHKTRTIAELIVKRLAERFPDCEFQIVEHQS